MLADGDPRLEAVGLSQSRRADPPGGDADDLPGGQGEPRKPGLHRGAARLRGTAQAELAEPVARGSALQAATSNAEPAGRSPRRAGARLAIPVRGLASRLRA